MLCAWMIPPVVKEPAANVMLPVGKVQEPLMVALLLTDRELTVAVPLTVAEPAVRAPVTEAELKFPVRADTPPFGALNAVLVFWLVRIELVLVNASVCSVPV